MCFANNQAPTALSGMNGIWYRVLFDTKPILRLIEENKVFSLIILNGDDDNDFITSSNACHGTENDRELLDYVT